VKRSLGEAPAYRSQIYYIASNYLAMSGKPRSSAMRPYRPGESQSLGGLCLALRAISGLPLSSAVKLALPPH
jgi:hypothetical protein